MKNNNKTDLLHFTKKKQEIIYKTIRNTHL